MANIIISLFGSEASNSSNGSYLSYVYPETEKRGEWYRQMFDARSLLKCKTEDFAMWQSTLGRYYAIIFPSENDTRGGLSMITIFCSHGCLSPGNKILSSLRKLKNILSIHATQSERDNQIRPLAEDLESSVKKVSDYRDVGVSANNGYRLYNDDKEVIKFFEWQNQKEYAKYKHVFIINQKEELPTAQQMQRISSPIEEFYAVRPSVDSRVSSNIATRNSAISITYKKPGYDEKIVNATVEDNSPYLTIQGTEVLIKIAEEANIKFNKTITFSSTQSDKTFRESLGEDAIGKNIQIPFPGFEKANHILTKDDFEQGYVQISNLVPSLKPITIYVDGRQVQDKVPANSKIYQEIKKGKKVYISNSNPQTLASHQYADEKKGFLTARNVKSGLLVLALLLLLIAGICYAFGLFSTEPAQQQLPQPDPVLEVDDVTADLDYLTNNTTWVSDSIKSVDFKALFNFIKEGDVESILSRDSIYSGVGGEWPTIFEYLQKLNGRADKKEELVNALKQAYRSNDGNPDAGEINVNTLKGNLETLDKKTEKNKQNEQNAKDNKQPAQEINQELDNTPLDTRRRDGKATPAVGSSKNNTTGNQSGAGSKKQNQTGNQSGAGSPGAAGGKKVSGISN